MLCKRTCESQDGRTQGCGFLGKRAGLLDRGKLELAGLRNHGLNLPTGKSLYRNCIVLKIYSDCGVCLEKACVHGYSANVRDTAAQ